MQLPHTLKEQVLVIQIPDAYLDAETAPSFKSAAVELTSHFQVNKVVLDLEKLQFIDSSGLAVFLSILKMLKPKGGDLKLSAMSNPVRSIFEVVKMYKLFEIYPSSDHAIAAFNH